MQFVRCWECSNEVGELLEVIRFTKFNCVRVISAFNIMKKNPKSIVLKFVQLLCFSYHASFSYHATVRGYSILWHYANDCHGNRVIVTMKIIHDNKCP